MKVALFCFVIFAFVVAQHDHVRVSLPQINLSEDLTQETTPVHEEFFGSASGVIANNLCREYFHTVTPVRSSGHINSGTYFVVEFTAVQNAAVSFTFGLPNQGDAFDIQSTTGGTVQGSDGGTCAVGATCRFEYYCDIYPISTTLEINTRTADGTSPVETASYDVSVRQYTDLVPVIQRTFTQSPAVVRPYAAPPANLGPENWVHYYHDLQPTIAELVAQGTLYIRVTVNDAAINGDSFICVSQDGIVANNEANPGSVNGLDVNGDLLTGDNFLTSLTPCTTFCARRTLDATNRFFYIAFDAARFCGDTDLWIGVRTPAAATYTIDIFFNPTTIPVFESVSLTSGSGFTSEGRLSGPNDCDVANGDYSCNAYYVISAATIQANAGPDARFGPIIDIEAFGALNGDFIVHLSTTLQADANAGCAVSQSCTFCDGVNGACTGESSCHLVLQPCEIMPNVDYVVTVESIRRADTSFSADFGIHIGVESSPLTTVAVPDILFGQLTIDHYAHYQVVFTEDDINTDSYFEVQMNPSNPVDDSIAFAWNLNQPAGVDCFTSRGICRTQNTDCGVGYDSPTTANTARTFCRFLFLACPISEQVDQYVNPNSNPAISPNGEKVSALVPGTYYFAVWVPGTSSNYNAPAVEYTLNFNFRHAVPLYENTIAPSSVYYLDYTPQFVITVPSDPTIGTIEIIADNVRNGIVRFYAKCGRLAGDCPCWEFDSSCSAQPDYPNADDVAVGTNLKLNRCVMRVPKCACDSNLIYVSAKGIFPGGQSDVSYQGNVVNAPPDPIFGADPEKPATFTLLALFHKIAAVEEVEDVFVSRAGTVVTGTLENSLFFEPVFADRNTESLYYSVKFGAVETLPSDALFFNLFGTVSISGVDFTGDFDFPYSTTERLVMAVGSSFVPDLFALGTGGFAGGCPFDMCSISIDSNQGTYELNSAMGSCSLVYQPCSNGCSGRDRSFNPDTEYFVSVTTPADNFAYYERPVAFSLQIQLVDQSPKVLTDGLRFWSGVGQSEYLHFSFDVASSPSNSRLVMELYREDQQQTPLLFYVNYFNGVGEPVWAGRSDDCYAHMFCEVCVLNGARQNKCVYDVSPCDLAQQSGVYYMSVSTNDFVNYPSAGLYPFYDDSADPFGGYSYNRNTMYHTGKSFFTLTARYETLTELLPSGLSIPGTGGLYIEESAFYSFTVPPTTGTIVGRIFSIEFVSYDTDLFVYLSALTPSVECTDCIESTTASQNTILRFRRTPCEREAQIYYLTISTPGGAFTDDCDRADYAVSGRIEDVTQSSVSLTTQASTRIPAFFDSSVVPVVPFSVAADQYHVISFNVNAVVGEFLAITITMDVPTAGAPTFDVLLAQDQFALPGSPNDDFGFGNNPASTCPAIAGQCNGVNQNAPCTIIIHPCSLPNGQSNWFITLSGEPLAPRTSTSNINVLIEKYGSENIIQNPAEGVIETTTTNLVLNDADILFYSYQTTDTLGIAGGESLRFTITNVNNFDLRIGDETGNGCASTCSGLTCEVFACSAVSPRIWYFYVNGNNGANPILTIERTAASPSSITSITSITPNVAVDRPVGQQNPNTPQAEFEYFQYSLPAVTAANSGRYSLTTTANAANLYFLDSTTFLPGFTATGTQRVMFSDLQTGTTCGGVNRIPLDSAECCYDAVSTLFAVRNQNTPYSITLETESYLGTVSSLGSSGTVTNVILGDDRVDLISVSVASGNDLIFDVSATVGNPRIYLNRGSNAGSGAAAPAAGFCFGNIDIIDDICPGNTVPCSGTIPACRLASCTNAAATGTNTFTFAVIGTTGDSYTISANSFSSSTTLPSSGSRTLNFPISAVTVTDTSNSADAFALYAQYQYVYATNPVDLTNYIPVASDGFNPQLYPRVVFQFSNFADSTGPVTEPFDIFIAATPAGVPTSGCYAGNTEIQNPHNGFLPCLENPGTGAADATTTPGVITCSVNVCSLGCGASVYFGFAKDDALPPTSSSFTFSFSATEQYNDLQTANSINNLALAVNGNTNVIRPDADNDAIVYVRVTQPGVGPGQFPVFTVTPSAATTRTLNVQRVDGGFSCDGTPAAIPNSGCGAVSQTQTCLFEGNPCTSEFNSIDSTDPVFYRVSSTGTGAWGFTFSASVTTIQRIDTAATSLSTAQSDYAGTKEITDFTWHFYSFSVADNDGYSTLSVSVSNVLCEAAAASLEVYSNWGSNNPLGSFADSHLPNQWPSDTCNLDSATLTGNNAWTSYAMDTCEFNAGGYRVAIFADRNTQLFPDPQTLPGPVPTVYSISASLSTLPRITLTGCSLTQQLDVDFIQRIEIPIEAANRGSRLKFHLTKENVASTATLQVSRNSYTYGLTNTCHFDDDTDAGVYSCTANAAAATCEIEINRCSFFDGMWYAFISSSVADNSDLTVSYTIDTPYIPVIDSVANSGQAYTGRLLNDDDDNDNYQFYKITGSSAFITELRKTNTCDFPGSCQITQTLFTGARGHGYTIPTEPSLADCNDQCDCACGGGTSCTVANIGDVCREFISGCSSNSDYFIGLVTPNFDIDCTFSLTVTDIDPSTAVTLNPSVSTCVSNPCVNLFEVNIPAGQIGLLNVVGNSGNVVPRAANQLYFSADTNCFAENQACFSDSPLCQFDLTSCEIAGLTNTAYILIIAGDCSTCTSSDSGYSIEVILEDAQPAVVNVGTPLAAGSAFGSITVSSPTLANQDLRVFGPEVTGPISLFSICPTACASALLPGSYVVANPSAGLTLSSLSITTVTTAAVTTTLNGNGEQNFFSYVVPAGVTSFQVFFESVTYSPFDLNGGDINNLDIEYTGSFGSIPAFGCTLTCGNNNDPLGTTLGCTSSFAPRTIAACPGSTYYFALSICNSLSCPVTLSVRVAATASATLAPGGTHANAFTRVSATRQDCLATAPNLSLYTTVTDILLVSVRQPGSLGAAGDTVSVTVSSCAGAYGACSIDRTDDGVDSSCSVPQGCSTAHCAASGQYQISFSAPAAPYEFEYQIITQYVDLASAISQTIIGDHTHFYRVTDAENALSISLDIASGPGLKFTVLDGCQFDVTTGFVETQFCAFGTCNTWLPTAAKQSSNAGLYITLDSSTNTAAIARNTKEINVNYEKDTAYTLTVVRGAANCGSPPTSGFCADPSSAGINVWSDVTNNVWTYSDMSSKDSEAECYYNSLLQRCAAPSTECKQFLKTYACVSTFPQCDANGYQMGVCSDLCTQVEAVCGKFAAQGFELLDCSSPSYTPASTGSCANNLPVTQPPVVVDPLSFFNDDDDDLSAVLFSTLDTPSFDTIVATIPPIVNDDDDDKLFVNNEVTIPANDTSDSSAIAFSAFFLLFVVFLI